MKKRGNYSAVSVLKKATLLCFIFTALAAGTLYGQEAENMAGGAEQSYTPEYRIEEDGRIVQTLTWNRSNAYYYEVEIQRRNEAGEWEPHAKERTEEIFLEVSLPPGMYRYRILSYNVLGRVAAASGWTGVRIYPAREPTVENFSPAAFYIDGHQKEFTLILQGYDLMDEAAVYIVAKTENAKPVEPLSIRHSEDGASLSAVFSAGGLALGNYDIVITNPGGLRSVKEGFAVSFKQPIDLSVSLGYAPFLPLYGSLFKEYDSRFYPLGFYSRFSALLFKRPWGNIGGELSVRFADITTKDERFTLNGRLLVFTANALYQRQFRDYTMALNFRLGGGLAPVIDMQFEHNDGSSSEKQTAMYVSLAAGASWQWYLWRGLFVEAGLDYIQLVTGSGTPPGLIQASAGAGWRF
jgi:hypothetical protein